MPKVERQGDQVEVHVGDYWKLYEREPERFTDWGWEDPGRVRHSRIKMAHVKGIGWVVYSWWFPRGEGGVTVSGRTLYVHDPKMLQILKQLDAEGKLSNYTVKGRV